MSTNRTDQQIFTENYQRWIAQQQADLEELLSKVNPHTTAPNPSNQTLRNSINECLAHYCDYVVARERMSAVDAPALFSPKWNSSFENAHLWIAGCRPSMFFWLLYSLCGHEVETRLDDYLEGLRIGSLGELTCDQMNRMSNLQRRAIQTEDKLSKRMAKLQEEVADQPLALVASERVRCSVGDIDTLVDKHASALGEILTEADELRFTTLREMAEEIFSPRQAVDFLIAAKRLHFRVHESGLRRDQHHGRG